jgi:hypothetical protein
MCAESATPPASTFRAEFDGRRRERVLLNAMGE